MSNIKKLMMTAAGGDVVNVEDVFSTFIYDGTSAAQTITNGIDLNGEGGLVWTKNRDTNGYYHNLIDTERGISGWLRTDSANAEITTFNNAITSFNSNGYSLGTDTYAYVNNNGKNYVSWTFRKAPKFFDIVTYTGDGQASKTISHNLGTTPGAVIVKSTSSNYAWYFAHRSIPNGFLFLNQNTNLAGMPQTKGKLFASDFTSTTFTVREGTTNGNDVNVNGGTFIAYVFAHNNSDGEFGPTGDQDIIKCGSYTADGSEDGSFEVNLGFEPQFLLVKNISQSYDWIMHDSMRGLQNTGGNDNFLQANSSLYEANYFRGFWMTPTGFQVRNNTPYIGNGSNEYIYIAIRRGPMAVPESATDVFSIDTSGGTSPTPPRYTSGFPVDMALRKTVNTTSNWELLSRLMNGSSLRTNGTTAEDTGSGADQFDYQDGYNYQTSVNANQYSWMWRRAPKYFDVVSYKGNGTAGRNISHSLGVAPEMIWIKNRSTAGTYWGVYHADLGNQEVLFLNDSQGDFTNTSMWGSTTPTDTQFTVGTYANIANQSGSEHIAYLFASLDGISKVGSYTGTGASQTIDCGFSSGARFVLIKETSGTGNWMVWDSERGITSTSSDGVLQLNSTGAELAESAYGYDMLQPHNSGFTLTASANAVNYNGNDFIFYAVA
jgi:hypothetical protein